MKGIRGLLAIACLLAAAPAVAGTVYRCDSADGGRSYVSRRVAGAHCVAIAHDKGVAESARRAAVTAPTMPVSTAVSPATVPAHASATAVTFSAPAVAVAGRRTSRLVHDSYYSYILDGVRHYASRAPGTGAGATMVSRKTVSFMETCFACAPDPGVNFRTLSLNTAAYSDEIRRAARQYGVDEAVVRAIIHAESAFNPNALSRVGAQGLMQLMPGTARRFGVGNPFDAVQNIQGGVQYLAFLLKRFNGDLALAAAGYNAGEGAVDKYKGVPPYSETQRYVQRVGILAARYRGSLATAK